MDVFHKRVLTSLVFLVLTYIDVSATFVGIEPNFSFYLISIANASSGFGRVAAGLMSDRIGSSSD